MRRAAKVDASQQEIVKALRKCGMSVEPKMARVGDGVPDLLVGFRNKNFLLETKTGERDCDRKLTVAERDWHATWAGQVVVVSSPDEAVTAVLRAAGEIAANRKEM